jgi:hypothetical protein
MVPAEPPALAASPAAAAASSPSMPFSSVSYEPASLALIVASILSQMGSMPSAIIAALALLAPADTTSPAMIWIVLKASATSAADTLALSAASVRAAGRATEVHTSGASRRKKRRRIWPDPIIEAPPPSNGAPERAPNGTA